MFYFPTLGLGRKWRSQSFRDIKAWLLLATTYGFTAQGTVTTFFPTYVLK